MYITEHRDHISRFSVVPLLTCMPSPILCQEKSSREHLVRKGVTQGIYTISLVLPTCDLIFYFPLHVQRLHIDSAVANKSCTCNPSVWLTESIFFILISKNRAQMLAGAIHSHPVGSDCVVPKTVARGRR